MPLNWNGFKRKFYNFDQTWYQTKMLIVFSSSCIYFTDFPDDVQTQRQIDENTIFGIIIIFNHRIQVNKINYAGEYEHFPKNANDFASMPSDNQCNQENIRNKIEIGSLKKIN